MDTSPITLPASSGVEPRGPRLTRRLGVALALGLLFAGGCVGTLSGADETGRATKGVSLSPCHSTDNRGHVSVNAGGTVTNLECCEGPECGEAPPEPAEPLDCAAGSGCQACQVVQIDTTLDRRYGTDREPPSGRHTIFIRPRNRPYLWTSLPRQTQQANWGRDRATWCRRIGDMNDRPQYTGTRIVRGEEQEVTISLGRFCSYGAATMGPGTYRYQERWYGYAFYWSGTSTAVSDVFWCDDDGNPLEGEPDPSTWVPIPTAGNPGGVPQDDPNAGPSGDAAGEPVELRFGSFYEHVAGLSVPGAGPALETHLRYASQQTGAGLALGSAGPGWTVSYSRRLLESGNDAAVGQVWLLSEDGQAHHYVESEAGSGEYALRASPGSSTLRREGDGWVLEHRFGRVETYDASGALTSVTDRLGNTLTFTVSTEGADVVQRLESSASGLALERVYRERPSGALRLAAIRGPGGRQVTMEYDAMDRLVAVVDAVGVAMRFGYDALDRMVRVEDRNYDPTDPEHGPLLNEYDGDTPRVLRQTMSNGLRLDFAWAGDDPAGPGRIEAEAYDAYVDVEEANRGAALSGGAACDRGDGVDLQPTSDPEGGVCNVGWTRPGERLDYTIEVPTAGLHRLSLRLASQESPRSVAVSIDGEVVGEASAPGCGWQCWGTDTVTAELGAGTHVVSLGFAQSGLNVNYFELELEAPAETPDVASPKSLAVTYTDTVGERASWTRSFSHDAQRRIVRAYVPGAEAFEAREYDPVTGELARRVDPEGRVTAWTHDPATRDVRSLAVAPGTDASGTWTYSAHDAFGQPGEIEDPTGRRETRSYDDAGLLLERVVHGDGGATRVTTYAYDDAGRLLSVTTPEGVTTRYVRDERGWVERLERGDTNPVVEEWSWDDRGAVTRSVDGRGVEYAYETDAAGRVTAVVTDPSGASERTVFEYDGRGNVVRMVAPDGSVSTADYVEAGELFDRPAWRVDGSGARVELAYDAMGRVLEERLVGAGEGGADRIVRYGYAMTPAGLEVTTTGPEGETSVVRHDLSGRPVELVDARGAVTRLAYDAAGRRVEATVGAAAVDGLPAVEATTASRYDAAGRLVELEGPNGVTRTLAYDGFGRLRSVSDASGRSWTRAWDEAARTVTESVGDAMDASVVRRRFDDAMRIAEVVRDPAGLAETTTYTYGSVNRVAPAAVTAADGEVTAYEYDGRGRLSATIDAAGSRFTFARDHRGNVVEEQAPTGRLRRFRYDGAGRLVELEEATPGGATRTRRWVRGLDGQPVRFEAFDGQPTGYRYDGSGRLVGIDEGDDGSVETTLAYLPNGLRSVLADANGTTEYGYDAANRLVSRTRGGRTVSYERRADGRVSSLDYFGAGTVEASWDGEGLLAGLARFGVDVSYGFDGRGALTAAMGPEVSSSWEHDGLGRVAGLTHATASETLEATTITRDPMGRRVGQSDADGLHGFAYDSVGRIEDVSYGSVFGGGSYDYDAVGNRVGAGGVAQAFDGFDQLADRPYDAAGRLLEDGFGRRFRYDARGRLARTEWEGHVVDYRYDGLGQLVGFTLDGEEHELVLDESGALPQVLAALGPDSETLYAWGPEGLSAVRRDGEVRRTLPGADGSVRIERGADDGLRRFDVWGAPEGSTGAGTLIRCASDVGTGAFETTSTNYVGSYPNGFRFDVPEGETLDVAEVLMEVVVADHVEVRTAQVAIVRIPDDSTATRYSFRGPWPQTVEWYRAADERTELIATASAALESSGLATIPLRATLPPGRYALLYGRDGFVEGSVDGGHVFGVRVDSDQSGCEDGRGWFSAQGSLSITTGLGIALRARSAVGVVAWGPGYRGEWHNPDGTIHLRARTYHPGLGVFLQPDAYLGRPAVPASLHRYSYAHNDPVNLVDPTGFVATGGPGGGPTPPGGMGPGGGPTPPGGMGPGGGPTPPGGMGPGNGGDECVSNSLDAPGRRTDHCGSTGPETSWGGEATVRLPVFGGVGVSASDTHVGPSIGTPTIEGEVRPMTNGAPHRNNELEAAYGPLTAGIAWDDGGVTVSGEVDIPEYGPFPGATIGGWKDVDQNGNNSSEPFVQFGQPRGTELEGHPGGLVMPREGPGGTSGGVTYRRCMAHACASYPAPIYDPAPSARVPGRGHPEYRLPGHPSYDPATSVY